MSNRRVVRTVLIIVGVIAILVGAVFAGQGAGLIPGSFMTGDRTWLIVGVIVAFVGIVLILVATTRQRNRRG